MKIIVNNGEMAEEEQKHYVEFVTKKYPDKVIEKLIINIDGDDVLLETHFKEPEKFVRIRRITGYLVGTLDRFNDGKRAEERDRVKHTVEP